MLWTISIGLCEDTGQIFETVFDEQSIVNLDQMSEPEPNDEK